MNNQTQGYVKVMRSHDYCHFEVCLPLPYGVELCADQNQIVDGIRKEAARLTDKAVEQYKAMKVNLELGASDQYRLDMLTRERDEIEKIPEGERTTRQKAVIKFLQDRSFSRRRYSYQDDWEEESFPEFDDQG